jgi:hypothetical protein
MAATDATRQPQDFADLYNALVLRVRVDATQSATLSQAKSYINTALFDMHMGPGVESFEWAHRDAILVTQPKYTTGTVAITKGSTALTGTGTLWSTANDFSVNNMRTTGRIVIGGSSDVYRISAVGSDTGATLGSSFVGDTVTAATYTYFEDEYALNANFLRPLNLTSFSTAMNIPLIGRRKFENLYPRNSTPGKPVVGALYDKDFGGNTTRVQRLRLHAPPDIAYSIPYSFITNKLAVSASGTAQANLSADTDEPILPLQYRHALVEFGLWKWYRDKKNDDRAAAAEKTYTDMMLRLIGNDEIGEDRPRLQPIVSPYKRRARRPWDGRNTGRRYISGSAFDERRE